MATGVSEAKVVRDIPVLIRGEMDRPGETVPRGFVQILCNKEPPKIEQGSGRLELAEWIASADNPLTARVMVNRVWLHLFGEGLVASADNFGTTGQNRLIPSCLTIWQLLSSRTVGRSNRSFVVSC